MSAVARSRAARALRRHAPELDEADLRELGSGLDHAAFVVGGLVLRVSHEAARSTEAELLVLLAERVSIPVPVPVFVDRHLDVLGLSLLPGRPLLGRTAPPGAAVRLGRFLRELHATDPVEVAELVPTVVAEPEEWLDGLVGPAALCDELSADRPEPTHQLALTHGDLGAEHILAEGDDLTGILDWSDAAVSDPALDFARLHRDFGPSFLGATLKAYGSSSPALRRRVRYFARCAALEDLAYGRETGRQEYARAAERSLAWLFPSR